MENTGFTEILSRLSFPKEIGKRLEEYELRPSYFLHSKHFQKDPFFKQRTALSKRPYGYTALHRFWSKSLINKPKTLQDLNIIKTILILLDENQLLDIARELGASFFSDLIVHAIFQKDVSLIKEKLGNQLYKNIYENYDNFKVLEAGFKQTEWSVEEVLKNFEHIGWLALRNIFSSDFERFDLILPYNLNLDETSKKLIHERNFSTKKTEEILTIIFKKSENPWLSQLTEAH